MAILTRDDIAAGLEHLGRLAASRSIQIELVVVGGAAMALAFRTRNATRDVDALIVSPRDAHLVRMLAQTVAVEHDWPTGWLNDAAKGYLVGVSEGPIIFSAPGIMARRPSTAQLLAMKLSAWRDDVDIADAGVLLRDLARDHGRETAWQAVSAHLLPGSELKAQYAFMDLWDNIYGAN